MNGRWGTARTALHLTLVLACGLATISGLGPLSADDETGYLGRRLVDVLRELEERGIDLIFSSAVVGKDVRVSVEPSIDEPRAMLEEILLPLGLKAEDGPAGSILILPASEPLGVPVREDPGAEPIAVEPAFVTEVVVTPNRHSVVREDPASRRTLTSDEAALAPTIGGDIARFVELLPGIAAADNSAAFHVRGSVARDVSMVLDGLELYDPFHLQGFQSPFSLIDANVVDRIDFFGGGFTADLGDRHGGFVEISTLVPQETPRGELEIGTLNSRISYRNPTSKSGAWLISARGWYPEAVRATTELGGGEDLDPRFADVYVKAAFNLTPRHRLSAHTLLAYDRLSFQEGGEDVNERVEARTKSGYAWLRMLSAWSTKWTSETMLSGGRLEREREGISEVDEPVLVVDDRNVDFFGLKHDSTWQISDRHVLKAGADVRWLDAEYRYFVEDSSASTAIGLDPNGTSLGVYAAYRARVTSTLVTELGARWDRQTHTNDNQLSPRFNAVWRPGERSEVRFALGSFSQSQRIHELQVEDGETEFSRAEVAKQVELSFQRALPAGLRFRVDAYYRELSDVRPRYENLYEPIELFPETTEDRVRVAPEEARLRGVELMMRGDENRPFFWWATYTLASAEDVIDGKYVFRSWDQTHAGRVLIGYRRENRWSVSLNGSIHTGWPITPAEVTTFPDIEPVLDQRNTDRYPTYVRVDFKARHSFTLSHGRLWLTLEVINVTDRDNACCVDEFQAVTQPSGEFKVRTVFDHWLGITPSFSVLWEF